jgi:hypothetical protein
MPLIPSNYINSWYKVQDRLPPNNFYIFRSITSTLNQVVEKRDYIQGDAGTHVMSIRDNVWSTSINSPVLIIKQLESEYLFLDSLDLFLQTFYKLRTYFKEVTEATEDDPESDIYLTTADLLSRATIQISDSGVDANLTYLNNFDQMFEFLLPGQDFVKEQEQNKDKSSEESTTEYKSNKEIKNATTIDYLSRTAKFYDVKFYIPEDNVEFIVKSGTINVSVDYAKLFFVNSNTSQPFYKPKGYSIQGEVDLIIPADIWASIIKPEFNNLDRVLPGQNFMQLIKEKVNCSIGIADGRMFKVGLVNATSDFNLTMDSGSLPSLRVKFETYASNF